MRTTLTRWWRVVDDDPFAGYRDRILYVFAVVTLVVFVPVVVNNFFQGRVVVGFGSVLIVGAIAADAVAIYFRKRPPVPLALIAAPAIPTMVLAALQLGFGALLWCYPGVLLLFFVAPRRLANFLMVPLLLVVVPTSLQVSDVSVTVRFFASLTMTAVFANLLVGVVGELHEQLRGQAITDPLTGTFNRRHMEARLAETVARCRRSGASASLVLADIDHFKTINDRFGHACGDAVLKEVTSILQRGRRRADAIFRIGGEEFLLLLPDTGEEDALALAERLRSDVAACEVEPGAKSTVSLGVAGLAGWDTPESWLKGADAALYLAKQGGRDRAARRAQMLLPSA